MEKKAILALQALLVICSCSSITASKLHRSSVIVVGAGMSGISAAKTLSDAGIDDIVILEATEQIGGRIHQRNFAGLQVEIGASWVEGINGHQVNPIWEMAKKINLRSFFSDYSNISCNTYKHIGGLYETSIVQAAFNVSEEIYSLAENFSGSLPPSGRNDMSVFAFQRLQNHAPYTPLEMLVDYYMYDHENAEPPRVTSLQRSVPSHTFANFGEDMYFVADQRGYESLVQNLAKEFLKTDGSGSITDPRLKLNKVVRHINHARNGVTVTTEDGSVFKADYIMISVSIGVLQTKLIEFEPELPSWKILPIYLFDMAAFTKVYLKFPSKFWPDGNGTEFFLYASGRRGYYPVWQHLDKQRPGANVLLVIVSDDESRRIEQQANAKTKEEAMEVLRNMFGEGIPEATEVLVSTWWSNRFFKGSFSNWPNGVNRHEYDQLRAPVGRIYFTGEHTSELYNGYVHGAYLAGIDSANMMIDCLKRRVCKFHIKPKDACA